MGFVFVIDAGEPKGDACGLDHGLVPKHALGVRLPRPRIPALRAVHFVEVLADPDRLLAVLAVNDALDPFGAGLGVFIGLNHVGGGDELEPIGLGVVVDDAGPAVDADDGNNAAALVLEGVDFLGEGVEAMLIGDDHEAHHLFVAGRGAVALLERRGLERVHDLGWVDAVAVAEALDEAGFLAGGCDFVGHGVCAS